MLDIRMGKKINHKLKVTKFRQLIRTKIIKITSLRDHRVSEKKPQLIMKI